MLAEGSSLPFWVAFVDVAIDKRRTLEWTALVLTLIMPSPDYNRHAANIALAVTSAWTSLRSKATQHKI